MSKTIVSKLVNKKLVQDISVIVALSVSFIPMNSSSAEEVLELETYEPYVEGNESFEPIEETEVLGPNPAEIHFECLESGQVRVTWTVEGDVEYVNGYSPEARPLDGSDWIVEPGSKILIETVLNNIPVSTIRTAPECQSAVDVSVQARDVDEVVTLPVTGSSEVYFAIGAVLLALGSLMTLAVRKTV